MLDEDEIRLNEIGNFLKESWCIDGDVKFIGFDTLTQKNVDVLVFELHDSKRGVFTIAIGNK